MRLLLIVALALALRLVSLGSGLWVDEIYSLLNSFRPPLLEIVTVFPRDNQHPLYSVLAHASVLLFGESAWAIRLPALLFGVGTVPALYWLGTLVAGRREAWIAALVLAVSYHHVWFSQNARGYSALAFFTVVATACLLHGLERGSRSAFVAYGAAAALGCYTHLTMVFVVVGHFAAWAAAWIGPAGRPWRQAGWRDPMVGFALAAAGTLLLYAPILGQVQHYFLEQPSGLRGVSTPAWALREGLRVLAVGLGGGSALVGSVVLAAAAALFALGGWSFARQRPLVLALFVAPGLVTIAGALAARGTMYPRFFFSLIGFGILVGLRGIMVASRGRTAPIAVMAGGVVLASLASLPLNYRHPKQDFDGARRWVESRRAPEDPIVTAGVATLPYRQYLGLSWADVETPGALDALRGAGPVWVVYTFPLYLDRAAPDLLQLIRTECPVQQVFPGTVGGGDILVARCAPRTAAGRGSPDPGL